MARDWEIFFRACGRSIGMVEQLCDQSSEPEERHRTCCHAATHGRLECRPSCESNRIRCVREFAIPAVVSQIQKTTGVGDRLWGLS